MSIVHPCLYTKHLVKKKKSWSDGFVVIKGSGVASLHAEDGSTLSSGVRLPAHATTSEEQIKAFDGYLVTIEPVACAPDALPASLQSLLSAPAAGPTQGPTGVHGQPRGATHQPQQQQGPHGAPAAPAARVAPVISGRRPLAFMPPKPLGASAGAREAAAPGATPTAPAAPAPGWRSSGQPRARTAIEQPANPAHAGQQATGWRKQAQPQAGSMQLLPVDKPHGISAHHAPDISSLCPGAATPGAGGTGATGPASVWSSHAPGAATAASNPSSARSDGDILGLFGLGAPTQPRPHVAQQTHIPTAGQGAGAADSGTNSRNQHSSSCSGVVGASKATAAAGAAAGAKWGRAPPDPHDPHDPHGPPGIGDGGPAADLGLEEDDEGGGDMHLTLRQRQQMRQQLQQQQHGSAAGGNGSGGSAGGEPRSRWAVGASTVQPPQPGEDQVETGLWGQQGWGGRAQQQQEQQRGQQGPSWNPHRNMQQQQEPAGLHGDANSGPPGDSRSPKRQKLAGGRCAGGMGASGPWGGFGDDEDSDGDGDQHGTGWGGEGGGAGLGGGGRGRPAGGGAGGGWGGGTAGDGQGRARGPASRWASGDTNGADGSGRGDGAPHPSAAAPSGRSRAAAEAAGGRAGRLGGAGGWGDFEDLDEALGLGEEDGELGVRGGTDGAAVVGAGPPRAGAWAGHGPGSGAEPGSGWRGAAGGPAAPPAQLQAAPAAHGVAKPSPVSRWAQAAGQEQTHTAEQHQQQHWQQQQQQPAASRPSPWSSASQQVSGPGPAGPNAARAPGPQTVGASAPPTATAGPGAGAQHGLPAGTSKAGGWQPPRPVASGASAGQSSSGGGYQAPRAVAQLQGPGGGSMAVGPGIGGGAGLLPGLALPLLEAAAPPQRLVAIPASFSNVEHYGRTMVAALVEEINLRLAESVQQMYGVVRRLTAQQPAGTAGQQHPHGGGGGFGGRGSAGGGRGTAQGGGLAGRGQGPGMGLTAGGVNLGGAGGGGFASLPPVMKAAELERACTAAHVPYFANVQLSCWAAFGERGEAGGGRGKGAGGRRKRGKGGRGSYDDGEGEEDDGEGPNGGGGSTARPKVQYYLTVSNVRSRLKNCRRHDIWVVGSGPLLQGGGVPAPAPRSAPGGAAPPASAAGGGITGGGGGGHGGAWRCVVRALWHGPDRDGKFEVEPLAGELPARHGSRQAVYALRGPDLQSEVQLAQLMQQQLVALTYSGSHTGKPLLLGRAAAAAAAAAQPQQGDIRSPLPLLRHLLQCLPPEPPLDLQAAAMAAAAEAASPAAGGRSRAFKAPRLAATGGSATVSPYGPTDDGPDGDHSEGGEQQPPNDGLPTAKGSTSRASGTGPAFDPASIARAHIERYRLNPDQAKVLLHCASWFAPREGQAAGCGDGEGGAREEGEEVERGRKVRRRKGEQRAEGRRRQRRGGVEDGAEGAESQGAGGARRRGGRRKVLGMEEEDEEEGGGDRVGASWGSEAGEADGGSSDGNGSEEAGDSDEDGDGDFVRNGGGAEQEEEGGKPRVRRQRRPRQRQRRCAVDWDDEEEEEEENGQVDREAADGGDSGGGGGADADAQQGQGQGQQGEVHKPESLPPASPVCLVHGPFGSGKSSLLVALIRMLVELGAQGGGGGPEEGSKRRRGQEQQQPGEDGAAAAGAGGGRKKAGRKGGAGAVPAVRVLLASHTNVAVDRVLVGLQDSGFSDFLRLGSLERMDRRVLHRSLRAGEEGGGGGGAKDAIGALKAMLQEAASPGEAALIRCEMEALAAGAEKARRAALRSCPVVGATICSLLQQEAAEDGCGGGCGGRFSVVVLDECSQMTEPLSLVPLLRGRPRFLVAAGDPLQLPPVVASPVALSPGAAAAAGPAGAAGAGAVQCGGGGGAGGRGGGGTADSLLRPMFVRLTQLGHGTHLLRYQYRCHPVLSSIANTCFYGGALRDGISAADRPPLPLPGLGRLSYGGGGGGGGGPAEVAVGAVRLPPLVFVDTGSQGGGAQHDAATRSSFNAGEAQLVGRVIAALLRDGAQPSALGVICFYRAQVSACRRAVQQHTGAQHSRGGTAAAAAGGQQQQQQQQQDCAGGPDEGPEDDGGGGDGAAEGGEVQVATVDSFQGAEKEVVLLATTVSRASEFAADARRLNVALTRARRHLVVIGSSTALRQTSPVFDTIIRRCQSAMATHSAAAGGGGGGMVAGAPGAGRGGEAVYLSPAGLMRLLEGGPGEGPGQQQQHYSHQYQHQHQHQHQRQPQQQQQQRPGANGWQPSQQQQPPGTPNMPHVHQHGRAPPHAAPSVPGTWGGAAAAAAAAPAVMAGAGPAPGMHGAASWHHAPEGGQRIGPPAPSGGLATAAAAGAAWRAGGGGGWDAPLGGVPRWVARGEQQPTQEGQQQHGERGLGPEVVSGRGALGLNGRWGMHEAEGEGEEEGAGVQLEAGEEGWMGAAAARGQAAGAWAGAAGQQRGLVAQAAGHGSNVGLGQGRGMDTEHGKVQLDVEGEEVEEGVVFEAGRGAAAGVLQVGRAGGPPCAGPGVEKGGEEEDLEDW